MHKDAIKISCDSDDYNMTAIDVTDVFPAPYVWKMTGTGMAAVIEAMMPGAYLKFAAENTATIGIVVDTTGNRECPPASMPWIEYSVDGGPVNVLQLSGTAERFVLHLAADLDRSVSHDVDLNFRAADLGQSRWDKPCAHLRLAGIVLDRTARLLPVPRRPKLALGFGDSITEGVGVEGHFTSWQKLEVNRAAATWFPLVCSALDCEYGQLGTGGQGILNGTAAMPALPQTWDHYDAATSRLSDGLLLPEPDYVFCGMGTNDFRDLDPKKPYDITAAYRQWLTAVRQACPTTAIFCVVPPFGWHGEEIRAAVTLRNEAGDAKVHLIDTAPLKDGFDPENRPSRLAYDGCHPSLYGQALLATLITMEVQKILSHNSLSDR